MGLPKPQPAICSVDEYLALERKARNRHYFLDGEIFAMAGESWAHGGLAFNLTMILGAQLRGKPCQARAQNTKVRSGPPPRGVNRFSGLYSYPDIVVVCNEPKFHDINQDVIVNPKAIIEVLSPSTESFDRGEKFTRYQLHNPTLTDYLLVSQDKPQIEHYSWKSNGKWSYETHTGMKSSITIRSIGCRVKMRDVYARIKFKPKKKPKPDSVFGEDAVE